MYPDRLEFKKGQTQKISPVVLCQKAKYQCCGVKVCHGGGRGSWAIWGEKLIPTSAVRITVFTV